MAAIALQPREEDFLGHFSHLSRQFPAELSRPALEIAILRRAASRKFPIAELLYCTREALEQASAWQVSTYRAQRYAGFDCVIDLGCSIGGDSLALAQLVPTTGIDLDPLRLAMAQANRDALGLEARLSLLQADLTVPLPLSHIHSPHTTALFFDPARRLQGRRLLRVEAYQPPLSLIKSWLPYFPALGVKISPGVKLDELREYDAEIEFISLNGELKEAVLWFGPLKTARRRATLLPGPHSLVSEAEIRLPLSPPQAYLYEPDPAVLRAGLVTLVGAQLGAAQLDADIAYLTSASLQPTPFARVWRVEDWFPFSLKRLRAYLRQRGVGRVTVKKRGSPLQPEALIADLRLSGEAERVVFLTHLSGKPVVVIALVD